MRITEQSLACLTEQSVVFGGGPDVITMFGDLAKGFVLADYGAHPEPRDYDVDGEVGGTLGSEQGLRLGEARGTEGPVP